MAAPWTKSADELIWTELVADTRLLWATLEICSLVLENFKQSFIIDSVPELGNPLHSIYIRPTSAPDGYTPLAGVIFLTAVVLQGGEKESIRNILVWPHITLQGHGINCH